jgi:putative transposase
MANTFSQLYIHLVFAVQGRNNLISKSWKETLYKYISGIILAKNQKLMVVNGMPDHIHLLIGISPTCQISELVNLIKVNSSKWINQQKLVNGKFNWQNGYGVFSVSPSAIDKVIGYIKNQEIHHSKKSFLEEYIDFLESCDIDYKPEFLFK